MYVIADVKYTPYRSVYVFRAVLDEDDPPRVAFFARTDYDFLRVLPARSFRDSGFDDLFLPLLRSLAWRIDADALLAWCQRADDEDDKHRAEYGHLYGQAEEEEWARRRNHRPYVDLIAEAKDVCTDTCNCPCDFAVHVLRNALRHNSHTLVDRRQLPAGECSKFRKKPAKEWPFDKTTPSRLSTLSYTPPRSSMTPL